MKNKKKLKINISNKYFNECWSVIFFCIIDANKELINWKYENYNFCTTNEGNEIIYGIHGNIYKQYDIFKDILTIKNVYYSDINKSIIEYIKEKITNNEYVIIMLLDGNSKIYHEFLFYGYDFNSFQYLAIINGHVKQNSIDFYSFVKLYLHTIENIKLILKKFMYKFDYFAPLTIIKLKSKKDISNLNIDKLFSFLKSTIKESNSFEKYYFDEVLICKRYDGYFGIINALLAEFNKYLYENKRTYNFPKNMKSFIMYRNLFFDYLNLFSDKLNFILKNYVESKQKSLDNILLILLKYKIYSKELIENISNTLVDIFQSDYNYVNKLYNNLLNILFFNK